MSPPGGGRGGVGRGCLVALAAEILGAALLVALIWLIVSAPPAWWR